MKRIVQIFLLCCISFTSLGQTVNDTLLQAAEKGDAKLLLKCLQADANVNHKTPYDSVTALMFASESGYNEIVEILLQFGANPNIRPGNGNTALHAAVTAFEFDIAELLVRNGAMVNAKDNDSITPLMLAAGYNDWMMSDMLLYYDADINAKSKDGTDALSVAALRGNFDVCELLIKRGANVNTSDNKGYTPLYGSAQNGHLETFKLLLENDASLKTLNIYMNNPIDAAILNDNINILTYVLDTLNIDKSEIEVSTSLKKKALVNNSDLMRDFLKKKNMHYKWPFFEKIGFTFNNHWNFHDYMMGGAISIHDINYNFALLGGVDARLAKKRVLVNYQKYYVQYWEHRTTFYAELRKNWSFYTIYRMQLGTYTGLKATTSVGKYLGTDIKPLQVNAISPHVGLFLDAYYAGAYIGYEYVDYWTEKLSPHKVNMGVTIFLHHKKSYYRKNKTIDWL